MILIAQHPARSQEIRTVLRQATWSMAATVLISLVAIVTDTDEDPFRLVISLLIPIGIFSIIRLCEVIWLVHAIANVVTAPED